MAEFDYQWANLPDKLLVLNQDRVDEVLRLVELPRSWYPGKTAFDAGCGSGRYTWALKELGCEVTAADVSPEAVRITRLIDQKIRVYHMDLSYEALYWSGSNHQVGYDLVFSFGMIHHTENPRQTFHNLATMVYPGGYLWVMVYHRSTQWKYAGLRWLARRFPKMKPRMADWLATLTSSKSRHGWYDAINPRRNYGFTVKEIRSWFEEEGLQDVATINKKNIWMRGRR